MMRGARTRLVSSAVLAIVVGACGRHDTRPAITDTGMVSAQPPVARASHFDVPLNYDITQVLSVVEHTVPTQFGSLDSVHQAGDDPRVHYAYTAVRGPFTAFGEGPVFHLRATLTYEARGFFKPPIGPTVSVGCGTAAKDPPRIIIELATPLSLTADWHLVSHTKLIRVERATTTDRDRCQVRLLRFDVTDRIVDAARRALTRQLPTIDHTIGGVDLTGHVTDWWKLLSHPIRLSDNAPVWLLLSPLRFRLGAVSGKGSVLTVHVGLDAHPEIITDDHEPVVALASLPPLAHDTVTNGFHILMEGVVDYATASRALTAVLHGKSVAEHGHSITIDSLMVAPLSGGRLALTVAFHGDAHGTLRFVGVPTHDAAKNAIAMRNLDYDLETDSPWINMYSWVRSDALRLLFREQALVPEGPVLDRGRTLLMAGLNRKIGDAMTLRAVTDSVAVRGLYVTAAGLVIRAQASGHATVSVKER